MKLRVETPIDAIKRFGYKTASLTVDVDKFQTALVSYRSQINKTESEEHFKQPLRELLSDGLYETGHLINTKGNQDISIYLGKAADSPIGVMFETKRPKSGEMIRADKVNVKAFHELVLYYFEERVPRNNNEIKHLVATDFVEFYVFDANVFDRLIFRNSAIKKLYDTKVNDKKDNNWFYPELARLIDESDSELQCVHFSLDKPANLNKTNRTAIYKLLSPQFLLKQRPAIDSNALNKPFYDELLHIIGLFEKKDGKKIKIERRDEADRNPGSFIELTI